MLEIKDLVVSYGKITAVKGISVSVEQGQVVCLIGTNGAGKTTTLRTISGLLRPESGSILFEGERIDKAPAHKIVTMGLAHSPEGRRIFPRMSVEENLLLGGYSRRDEPSMGLSPLMMQRIMQTVRTLRAQGTTILLVEQNAQAALKLADHGYVLEVGSIVLEGPGRDLLASDEVRKAYLGEE